MSSFDPDRIASRVRDGLRANAAWRPELHPRDRKGRFRERLLDDIIPDGHSLVKPSPDWDSYTEDDTVIYESDRYAVTRHETHSSGGQIHLKNDRTGQRRSVNYGERLVTTDPADAFEAEVMETSVAREVDRPSLTKQQFIEDVGSARQDGDESVESRADDSPTVVRTRTIDFDDLDESMIGETVVFTTAISTETARIEEGNRGGIKFAGGGSNVVREPDAEDVIRLEAVEEVSHPVFDAADIETDLDFFATKPTMLDNVAQSYASMDEKYGVSDVVQRLGSSSTRNHPSAQGIYMYTNADEETIEDMRVVPANMYGARSFLFDEGNEYSLMDGPADVMTHELFHGLHADRLGTLSDSPIEFDAIESTVVDTFGKYGGGNAFEFVAEMATALETGKITRDAIPDALLDAYEQMNGPEVDV